MWKVIVFSAIVCISPKAVMADLTVVPRNTVAKIGDSTHLNCSTNLNHATVHWQHGSRFVYVGGYVIEPYNVRFKIGNHSQGAFNLVIQSMELTDAGKYICQDDEGHGGQSSAELIVIEKDPICHPNMTLVEVIGPNSCGLAPEHVHFACSLSYSGHVPPELAWKRSGVNVMITEGVNSNITGKTATYTLTFKANDLSNDNRSFICETKDAINLQYKCSTPVMRILYAFSDRTNVRKSVDEKIVCSANSSQMCSYNWKRFNDQKEVNVSNNKVLKPDESGSYRCEAECQMRDESCVVVSMIIEIDSFSSSSTNVPESSLWWMVLLIFIGVASVIVLVLYFIRKRKNLQTKNQKTLSSDVTFRDAAVGLQCENEEGTSDAAIIEYVDVSEALTATVDPSYENLYSSMLPDRPLPVNAIYTELANVKSLSSATKNEDSPDKILEYANFGDIQTTEHL